MSLPYATFGLAVEAGKVVEAAPIARWTVGHDEHEVARYYHQRGAIFEPLDSSKGKQHDRMGSHPK